MKIEKRLQVLIAVAATFCFVPLLFFVQDIWDGKYIGYALNSGDSQPLWQMFIPSRWTLQYYMCLAIGYIQNTTGISYKIITNLISCLSLAGICFEMARILKQELKLEREYRLLAVLAFLVLPPWATLMSSIMFFHIMCIWAFMLAVRFRKSAPLPALLFLALSLALNSIFAFAVGYALFLGTLSVNKTNWLKIGLQIFLFSATLLSVFVAYRYFFPTYDWAVSYNSYNLRVSALFNYLGLFVGLLGGAWLLIRNKDATIRLEEFRIVAACCVLLFFAGFAYTYVGKPIKLEGTNSFTPRQAYLTAIPTAMLIAVMVRLGVQRMGRKISYGLISLLLTLSFCYQFVAFQQKYTQLYFENAIVDILRDMEAPRPGVVTFVADRDQIPKYLRDFPSVTDLMLYDAYGERRWGSWSCDTIDCPLKESDVANWKHELVNLHGQSLDNLYDTRMNLDLKQFNPFGNPLVYYYYLTDAFDRLGFEVTYESVRKLD